MSLSGTESDIHFDSLDLDQFLGRTWGGGVGHETRLLRLRHQHFAGRLVRHRCPPRARIRTAEPSQYRSHVFCSSHRTRLQTYEGGYGQSPHCEAQGQQRSHRLPSTAISLPQFFLGGTTYCALSILHLVPESHPAHSDAALSAKDREHTRRWLIAKQSPSGGFRGRTEKEPDACYSFWCGASLKVGFRSCHCSGAVVHLPSLPRFLVLRSGSMLRQTQPGSRGVHSSTEVSHPHLEQTPVRSPLPSTSPR